jgi:anti-sigma B factor antagonist
MQRPDPSAPSASFTQAEREGVPAVEVFGDVDVATSGAFRAALLEALDRGDGSLVVDFAGLDFIDSSGLGVLVGTLKRARERGGSVRIEHPAPSARKILAITGLLELFGLEDDADQPPS